MSVILTGGQSFAQVAEMFTISPAYGPGIARLVNMEGEDITGRKMYLEIPDTWLKPQFQGKTIDARNYPTVGAGASGQSDQWIKGIPNWALLAAAGLAVLMFAAK